jgi:hypothetical protein
MKQVQPNGTNAHSDILQGQSFYRRAASLVAVALMCLSGSALAQISYNIIDFSSTSLTLSGTAAALGGTYYPQGGNPAAMVDTWGGSLLLTQTTPGNYTFTAGITADLNPLTPFLPVAGGSPPVLGGIDNYGADTLAGLYVAYRDMTLSLAGGTAVQGGSVPVAGMGMTLGFTAAHLDFDVPSYPGFRGTVPLSSWTSPSGANTSIGSVSMSADGSTLTVPVTFTTTSYGAGGVTETWTGTLYAVIPEPSSMALFGVGLTALAAWNARRGKRSL